jgi:hypothetical protein
LDTHSQSERQPDRDADLDAYGNADLDSHA